MTFTRYTWELNLPNIDRMIMAVALMKVTEKQFREEGEHGKR